MLNVNRGYRSNVPTIVVLFSDGNDNNGSHAIDAATALINSGVSIFALYNNASDSSPNVPLLQYITQDKSRVMPLDLYYTLKQPFYDVINNFIKTTGVDPCHPPVYADIVFVMDHSENQVRAGEVGATTPVDYVVYQKILIKNIISQLGVSTRGHRYTLVHFSDGNSYQVPGTTSYTNKTGILFDTTESYVQSVMFGKIDSFPELNAGGATDLKLVMDIISNSVVPLIANITDPFPTRLTYMVVFTTGFHDNETNCCGDPLYSALRVQNSFKPDTIIPVMSGKLADRNATLLLEYTGYNNQLPLYDVKQNSTADSIVQTIQDAISAQKAINDARQTI
uniref:VWFA domain-containing protein n=1 Tax=Plectus sambesii TaxID=2011161 RepID=A0A914WV43_9BILA